MLAPTLTLLLCVVALPVLYLIYNGFFVNNLMFSQAYFTGLGNYIRLLTDSNVWRYVGHTLIYVVAATGGEFIIGLLVALALSQRIRFRGVLFALALIPWMVPQVAGSVMWRWMLHDLVGPINTILNAVGILSGYPSWLSMPTSALAAIILVDIWGTAPFVMAILYGGLLRIPDELREAMQIDGASIFHVFRHLTLPFIRPEIITALTLRTIFTFRTFGLVKALTSGGPGDATEVLATYIYRLSMQELRMGTASALGVLMIIATLLIAPIYLRHETQDVAGEVY